MKIIELKNTRDEKGYLLKPVSSFSGIVNDLYLHEFEKPPYYIIFHNNYLECKSLKTKNKWLTRFSDPEDAICLKVLTKNSTYEETKYFINKRPEFINILPIKDESLENFVELLLI